MDEREEVIVYQTIGGWVYRVLDPMDDERFSLQRYSSERRAKQAAERDGFVVRRVYR